MTWTASDLLTIPEDLAARHRLSVADYHKMGEVGIIPKEKRVELIEGELIDMSPIGSRHAGMVNRLVDIISDALHKKAIITVQNPILLGEHSEPQPDIGILRPRDDYYSDSHPQAGDALLLIEVADASARYDLQVKVPLYARYGIPEVWVIDLGSGRQEAYHGPENGEYRHADYYRSGTIRPKQLSGVDISIDALHLKPADSR
jgi:Uma2 family endonuclease